MRVLYLVVLVTLCLPLQAGDAADLSQAVEMFRSPHPAVRAEGTKIADRELRKLLAPLLKAMEDPDPEVRRRVRGAILALVPFHDREPETQKERANRLAGRLWPLWGQFNKQRIVRMPRFQMQPLQQKNLFYGQLVIQKAALDVLVIPNTAQAVSKFGVTGKFIKVANAGRGLRVNRVLKGSAAEQAGLLKGDTILSVNSTAFTNYKALLKALDPRRGWSGAKLKVMRGARIFEITVK